MGRVNPALLDKLEAKLKVQRRQIYRLIEQKSQATLLPSELAAIALAAENGISIGRYASDDDLAAVRQALSGTPVPPVRTETSVDRAVAFPRTRKTPAKRSPRVKRRGTSVFVVHGRNEDLRRSLFSFLRSIGLTPIEWRKAIHLTGKASPYVSEILDAAFREAVAVVVLLSPDDKAKLDSKLLKASDAAFEKKLTGQARPNVLFEAGMAFGRNPDSTVLIQVGDVRPFSDIGGRHVVHLSNSTESRQELITKLANAGCNTDASGTDWHTEGDFRP